ncbi:MAG: hypothetical protein COA70_07280 [Planctomycetota bacterium]|nr:MAG: hypothetical protein COA70_07280 [Planctomycetota bacterium]
MGESKSNLLRPDTQGLTFLEHSQALLQSCCHETMVLGQALYAPGSAHIADTVPFAGPLKALADALPKVHTKWVLLIPVDMPDLTSDLLHKFQASAEKNGNGCFTAPKGQPNGFPLAIPNHAFQAIRELQVKGETSLFRGIKTLGFASWTPSGSQLGLFMNINSPEQLRAWRSGAESPSQKAQ